MISDPSPPLSILVYLVQALQWNENQILLYCSYRWRTINIGGRVCVKGAQIIDVVEIGSIVNSPSCVGLSFKRETLLLR